MEHRQTTLWAMCTLALLACSGGDKTTGEPDAGSAGNDAAGGAQGTRDSSVPLGPNQVRTETGIVEGDELDGVHVFKGIPYAAPPTGDLRFQPPQAVEPWDGVLETTAFGDACATFSSLTRSATGSEDCLYLNVYTPALEVAAGAPVMVWIHGGRYTGLSGGFRGSDGSTLARERGVVVVTINYRLHALGFLAHTALSEERGGSSGNYGIMDQRRALEWVRDNITAFGGDADKVTIFGGSAGGNSVCIHLASPDSRGLFHRAVSMSGYCTSGTHPKPMALAEDHGERVAEALDCTDLATAAECLREATAAELAEAAATLTVPQQGGDLYGERADRSDFAPVIDGEVIPDPLFADAADVPVLLGTVADEGAGLLAFATPVQSEADYMAALVRRFGDDADAIAARYPDDRFATPNDALAEVTGDSLTSCPARRAARQLANLGLDVYLYVFDVPLANQTQGAADQTVHGGEGPFLFGDPTSHLGQVSDADEPIAQAVRGYWTRFADTGDPNGENAVTWSPYDPTRDEHLAIENPITVSSAYKKDLCDFWDSLQ